jgi:hypothetical protein
MQVLRWFRGRCSSILLVDYRASYAALGLYRIAFAAFHLFVIGAPRVGWIAQVPATFFDPPPGPARLLPGFPPAWQLESLDLLVVSLFVALLLGWRTRLVSIALTVLLFYGHLFEYSFGKIDHDAIALLCPLLFAWSWGKTFSLDAQGAGDPGGDGLARGALASLLTFGFITAGLPKLTSWIDFDLSTHGVMSWVLYTERADGIGFLVPWFRGLDNVWVWEALDVAAVAFELGVLVALFVGPRAFQAWCVLAVLFHTLNYLMLDISFLDHLPLYLAFIDWEPAAAWFGDRTASIPYRRRRWAAWLAGLASITVTLPFAGESGDRLNLIDLVSRWASVAPWKTIVVFASASAIAIGLALLSLRQAARYRSTGRLDSSCKAPPRAS